MNENQIERLHNGKSEALLIRKWVNVSKIHDSTSRKAPAAQSGGMGNEGYRIYEWTFYYGK